MLQVDLKNAFNCVSRDAFLRSAALRAPALYNFLRFALVEDSPLFCGYEILSSQSGVHQGCPLGPISFALRAQDIIESLATQFQLIWNVWYLDDGLLVG